MRSVAEVEDSAASMPVCEFVGLGIISYAADILVCISFVASADAAIRFSRKAERVADAEFTGRLTELAACAG